MSLLAHLFPTTAVVVANVMPVMPAQMSAISRSLPSITQTSQSLTLPTPVSTKALTSSLRSMSFVVQVPAPLPIQVTPIFTKITAPSFRPITLIASVPTLPPIQVVPVFPSFRSRPFAFPTFQTQHLEVAIVPPPPVEASKPTTIVLIWVDSTSPFGAVVIEEEDEETEGIMVTKVDE